MMMTNGGEGVVRRLLPPLTRRLSADGGSRGNATPLHGFVASVWEGKERFAGGDRRRI